MNNEYENLDISEILNYSTESMVLYNIIPIIYNNEKSLIYIALFVDDSISLVLYQSISIIKYNKSLSVKEIFEFTKNNNIPLKAKTLYSATVDSIRNNNYELNINNDNLILKIQLKIQIAGEEEDRNLEFILDKEQISDIDRMIAMSKNFNKKLDFFNQIFIPNDHQKILSLEHESSIMRGNEKINSELINRLIKTCDNIEMRICELDKKYETIFERIKLLDNNLDEDYNNNDKDYDHNDEYIPKNYINKKTKNKSKN